MPKIIVKKPFDYWHGGCVRRAYVPAEEAVETDDECAAVAVTEGWAVPAEDSSKVEGALIEENADGAPIDGKAEAAAPENKNAAAKRTTKAA